MTKALVVAIGPEHEQAARLSAVVRRLGVDLILAESTAAALTALGDRVPDLILTPPLLSARDETAVAERLRELGPTAAHVQTVTVPRLGAAPAVRKSRGILGRLKRAPDAACAAAECDPDVFAQQVTTYLQRATAERLPIARAGVIPPQAEPVARQPEIAEIDLSELTPAAPLMTDTHADAEADVDPVQSEEARIEAVHIAVDAQPTYEPPMVAISEVEPIAYEPLAPVEEIVREVADSLERPTAEPVVTSIEAQSIACEPVAVIAGLEPAAYEPIVAPAMTVPEQLPDIEPLPAYEAPVATIADVEALACEPTAAVEELIDQVEVAPDPPCEPVAVTEESEPEPAATFDNIQTVDSVAVIAEPESIPYEPTAAVDVDDVDAAIAAAMALCEKFPEIEPVPIATLEDAVDPQVALAEKAPIEPILSFSDIELEFWIEDEADPRLIEQTVVSSPASEGDAAFVIASDASEEIDMSTLLDELERSVPATPAEIAPAPEPVPAPRPASKRRNPPAAEAQAAPATKTSARRAQQPPQDEWGLFDPDQCGFAALLAKLEEVTEDDNERPDGTSTRIISYS